MKHMGNKHTLTLWGLRCLNHNQFGIFFVLFCFFDWRSMVSFFQVAIKHKPKPRYPQPLRPGLETWQTKKHNHTEMGTLHNPILRPGPGGPLLKKALRQAVDTNSQLRGHPTKNLSRFDLSLHTSCQHTIALFCRPLGSNRYGPQTFSHEARMDQNWLKTWPLHPSHI